MRIVNENFNLELPQKKKERILSKNSDLIGIFLIWEKTYFYFENTIFLLKDADLILIKKKSDFYF